MGIINASSGLLAERESHAMSIATEPIQKVHYY